MASGKEGSSAPAGLRQVESQQTPGGMSTPTSPTDTLHPTARYESITHPQNDGLSSSFQSTDTVRRRPEAQKAGYGMFILAGQSSFA